MPADRAPAFVVTCPKCRSPQTRLLRHWSDPPRPGVHFNPTHRCEHCGHEWIYRSPKEKLRSFIDH